MKKFLIKFLGICSVISLLIPSVYAAYTVACATLYIGNAQVETSAVGLATSCRYTFQNSSVSEYVVMGRIRAAWDGWPYTQEVLTELDVGEIFTGTETQSKSSSFKGKLNCTKKTAKAYVTVRID